VAAPLSVARPLVVASLVGLVEAVVLALLGLVPELRTVGLWQAHGAVALYGFLLPALAAATVHGLHAILGRTVPPAKVRLLSGLWLGGALALALVLFLDMYGTLPALVRVAALALGGLVLLAASGMTTGTLLRSIPRRRESVVDVARDPLTKGDDACAAQLRFAQFFLPLGVLAAVLAAPWWGWGGAWIGRVHLAGIHLLAGHVLVATYGLAHLWIPRLSGVPAIAAGAIKGELHSTLLGLVLLVAGFLSGLTGLIIAGGAFAFLGAFTFMGVIGANIMRNKSKTQRVTPEFTYIPWAFTAVFWLLSGVLLGIFLNAVPEAFAGQASALRFTHVHIALLGGAAQVLLALAWRILPAEHGNPPPPFAGMARFGFFAFNGGLCALLYGRFHDGLAWFDGGAVAVALGLALSLAALARARKA
jgi:hypothetical protein